VDLGVLDRLGAAAVPRGTAGPRRCFPASDANPDVPAEPDLARGGPRRCLD